MEAFELQHETQRIACQTVQVHGGGGGRGGGGRCIVVRGSCGPLQRGL